MKKYFTIVLVLFVSWQSQAQNTFAPMGAEWWYYTGASMPNHDFYKLDHAVTESDTVIMGTPCTKIVTTRQLRDKFSPLQLIQAQDSTLYFYSNSDTAFVFNTIFNRFTPLYIFNAQVGDTICLPVPPSPEPDLRINPYTGDTSFCFVIDSIKTELYDTAHLKTFYTKSLEDFSQNSSIGAYPSYNWGHIAGRYTERVGGKWGLLPEHGHDFADFSWRISGPSGDFRCYSDSLYNIKMVAVPCDSMFYSLGINDVVGSNPITLYPNPSSGLIFLERGTAFPAHTVITLLDNLGRVVKVLPSPAGKIKMQYDLQGVMPGVYYLQMEHKSMIVQKKVTIIF